MSSPILCKLQRPPMVWKWASPIFLIEAFLKQKREKCVFLWGERSSHLAWVLGMEPLSRCSRWNFSVFILFLSSLFYINLSFASTIHQYLSWNLFTWKITIFLFAYLPNLWIFHEVKKTPHVDPRVLHCSFNLLPVSSLKSPGQTHRRQIQNHAIKQCPRTKHTHRTLASV